jgi:hypothetical protein
MSTNDVNEIYKVLGVEAARKSMLEEITSSPLFQPAAAGTPFATLLEERVLLRKRDHRETVPIP